MRGKVPVLGIWAELHKVAVELNWRYSSPVDFDKQIVSKYLCLPQNNLGVDDKSASCKKG